MPIVWRFLCKCFLKCQHLVIEVTNCIKFKCIITKGNWDEITSQTTLLPKAHGTKKESSSNPRNTNNPPTTPNPKNIKINTHQNTKSGTKPNSTRVSFHTTSPKAPELSMTTIGPKNHLLARKPTSLMTNTFSTRSWMWGSNPLKGKNTSKG